MTRQLLRTACALTLLLSANAFLFAAELVPTQAQVEAARRQQLQALQKGDFTAADRHGKEADALEARLGSTRPANATTVAAPTGPVSSFFSAPPGNAAAAPAGTSSVFTPPSLSSTTPAAPSSTPAPVAATPRYTPPAAPAPKAASSPAAKAAPSFTPSNVSTGFTPTAPAPPPLTTTPTNPLAAPMLAEEPRPADVPPAVLELRAAQAELNKLEEFRMAESLTTRRGATSSVEPARSTASVVPSTTAPSTAFASAVTPSVNLASGSDDLRRKLDDLNRRKSELQLEAERLSKDATDWEARYNAAKAELARLEAESKGRERLLTIREELTRLAPTPPA